MNEILKLAIEQARNTMNNNEGGPFDAAIIDENGNILSISSNFIY